MSAPYLGDFALGSTFDFKFNTTDVADAPITLAGGVVSAYPGNSTTELTAGITLTVDFDARTGLHNVRVVATSGNGYATATNYALVITTGTVDSISVVGRVIAHFSIENRVTGGGSASDPWATVLPGAYAAGTAGNIVGNRLDVAVSTRLASAGYTAPDNASITTILGDTNDIQTRLPAALVGGRMDSSVGAMAAAVLTAAAIATDALTAAKIAADAVTKIQAGLATAAGVTALQADTDDIQTRLPAALVGGRMDASVGAMAANVLTATAIATDALTAAKIAADAIAEIQAGLATAAAIAALNNLSTAQVRTEVQAGLSVDTYAEPGAVPAATASLAAKIGWLQARARNKTIQSNTEQLVRNDADSATIGTATVADDGTAFTRGKYL